MAKGSREGKVGRVAGLVLAGGRSSRFGSEKAGAILAGRPLLDWSAAALAGVCEAVAVSAGPGSVASELAGSMGLALVADDPLHARGPLAGLAAGLAWAQSQGFDRLVTLPCDTPLVTAQELSRLLAAQGAGPAAYAVTEDGPQPLCAVWRVDLLGMLGVRLAMGRHPAVRAFLDDIEAAPVSYVDPVPFRNANTPDALARLEADLPVRR